MNKTKLVIFLMVLFSSIDAFSRNIVLNPGESIQEAVDEAKSGDTLVLNPGTYFENDITIRKPLTISGRNHPVIDGGGKGNIIIVASDHVRIVGLKLINTGASNMDDSAAIKFFDSSNCLIENNILENTFFGLHFSNSSHLVIRGNHMTTTAEREYQTGNGIHLWKCSNSKIENNYIRGHRDGIYLEFVTDTESTENTVEGNKRYGLHFMFSHDNSYVRNTFRNNGAGVAVMYTKRVLMKDNIFEENWGASSYGILLKDISDSEATGNIFYKNTIGIYMEGSSRILFKNNTFRENGWALKLMASCDENIFEANNFIGNTFDISTNGSVVLNTLKLNYWDKYQGYDLDRDKIGDVPYRPISMYSMIVEKVPAAVILWRSFLVGLLDSMERVIPSITPENMIDNSPKMRPYDFHKKTQ